MTEDEYPELANWPTAPKTIEAIRAIKDNGAACVIDGVLVDSFTASAIVAVYDACDDEKRRIMFDLPIEKIGHLAWRIVR